MKKRILACLLALVMLIGVMPTALAEESDSATSTGNTIYVDAQKGDDGQVGVGTTSEKAYKTVAAAVKAAPANGMNTIYLGEGTYTLYDTVSKNASTNEYTTGKSFTFVGAGTGKTTWMIGAPVPDPTKLGTEYNADYSFGGCKKVVFQNMTLSSYYEKEDKKDGNYLGFAHTIVTEVRDCVINGLTSYWGYTSATFTNTTFNCPTGDYALWTYSSPTMTFDNCTFNSTGKVINVYNENEAANFTINLNNCTVQNKGTPLKQVLNINDKYVTGFTINITGKTVLTGFDTTDIVDSATCSRLFGFGRKATTNNNKKTTVNFGNTTVWRDGKMVDAKTYHNSGVTANGVAYTNGVDGSNDSLYAEGYKDNVINVTPESDWDQQSDGSYKRTVTRKCKYCGYTETVVETKRDDVDDITAVLLPALQANTDDHYSYLIGYADGTVRPNGKITRAEVATIFFRLLDDDTRAKYWSSENNFSDVSADKWYNNAVSTLSRMGVIGGYADGTFRPDAPISRAEFAKIAVSFTQNTGSATYNYFTDVKTTDWFAPYVTAAKDAGLIEGYSDGSFKPESKITRAEACAIVNRTLGRKPSKAHMKISGRIDWPDVQTTDWFYEAIMEATNSHTCTMGDRVETWTGKLPQRDWATLETGWANAYTGR